MHHEVLTFVLIFVCLVECIVKAVVFFAGATEFRCSFQLILLSLLLPESDIGMRGTDRCVIIPVELHVELVRK